MTDLTVKFRSVILTAVIIIIKINLSTIITPFKSQHLYLYGSDIRCIVNKSSRYDKIYIL